MPFRKRFIILAFLLQANLLPAQDLTGTWEGDLGNVSFLQVNIVHVNETLCGYTWDYVYADRKSFCRAYFVSKFNPAKNEWILTGTSFVSSSGDHVLMRLKLKYRKYNGDEILEGTEYDPSVPERLFLFPRQSVYLRKVSNKPARILSNMEDCIKSKEQEKDNAKIKPAVKYPIFIGPVQPVDTSLKITVPKKPEKTNHTDSLKKSLSPVIVTSDSNKIAQLMTGRTNKEMKRLVVNEKNISLYVYDNGIIDSDTVSIFYNGKLILSHKRLSEKPIILPILLNEKTSINEIILFAENLGSIPPNTALIVVHAGDKRYELYSSASLTENAVIVFEYKPK